MKHLSQSPIDPAFVQNPYPFYAKARASGDLIYWEDYGKPCATTHAAVQAVLRDRRFGREVPPELAPEIPPHLEAFYAIEAHSMLEQEPPRHTRLRGLVLRAFTSRRIARWNWDITMLANDLARALPSGKVDLLPGFCQPIPVIIICRMLGVPDSEAPQLLAWSNAMVSMYQARRDREIEEAAARAASEFAQWVRDLIAHRQAHPADDLLTELIAAREDGNRLSEEELIATVILLLNAGHEATVHGLGNALKLLLETGTSASLQVSDMVEECLRFDPPLHMFTRYAHEEITLFGHRFQRGDQVALLLASANRDTRQWPDAETFIPTRKPIANNSFGAGLHFCIGAPLARLEMECALPMLFDVHPDMRLAAPPEYANLYHFHGLSALEVIL